MVQWDLMSMSSGKALNVILAYDNPCLKPISPEPLLSGERVFE